MNLPPDNINKTISREDVQRVEVAAAAAALRKTARWLWFRGAHFAVNGVLKWRWRIKWNKLWEYSRGLAYGDFLPGQRVLDFGGGATIPLFHLAQNGCEVLSLDIDTKLAGHTNAVAERFDCNPSRSRRLAGGPRRLNLGKVVSYQLQIPQISSLA